MWSIGGQSITNDWSHMPPTQAAVVHAALSVSGHVVPSGTGGCVHSPVCGLHAGALVQTLVSGWQTVWVWVWTDWPVSQPAVVQALLSASAQGVLSGLGGCVHWPVCGLQGGSLVQSLVSGGQGVCT